MRADALMHHQAFMFAANPGYGGEGTAYGRVEPGMGSVVGGSQLGIGASYGGGNIAPMVHETQANATSATLPYNPLPLTASTWQQSAVQDLAVTQLHPPLASPDPSGEASGGAADAKKDGPLAFDEWLRLQQWQHQQWQQHLQQQHEHQQQQLQQQQHGLDAGAGEDQSAQQEQWQAWMPWLQWYMQQAQLQSQQQELDEAAKKVAKKSEGLKSKGAKGSPSATEPLNSQEAAGEQPIRDSDVMRFWHSQKPSQVRCLIPMHDRGRGNILNCGGTDSQLRGN